MIDSIEIATPIKGISNLDLLAGMGPKEVKRFPLSKRGTIGPLISSDIKKMFPNRVYKTDGVTEPNILLVTRKK